MSISIIVAHLKLGSVNHAVAQTVLKTLQNNNCHVNFHDLYAEKFRPLLPVKEMSRETILPEVIALVLRGNQRSGKDHQSVFSLFPGSKN